mmetsp:Transcript_6157/g.8965  ORF Transcript_6157/g.8965 Transcript_6157/m.8965 type:complete len:292 (+) Transcript_6157:71-946(+)|eukprot:CAMPEP_0196806532 /NCGR_PEP_ID=MMETSP1362-20130617/6421_1 /TAXON_ID=163516 /ORGANISM="Leptocylindrus danicus, Strain CCMP1856" /LENGTH=291 /DNA_ID=CAMNT_0042180037 /DNA_START=53 /DNA_END=928 /DNA_ORIENTATION=+
MEPDELYTLRTCYYLGHYQLALDEAKNLARRPMPPHLKSEREELLTRALIASNQPLSSTTSNSVAIQMLHLTANKTGMSKEELVAAAESLLSQSSQDMNVQLYAALLFLKMGMTKEALKCVHLGATMEHLALSLQIYLKLDRLDLANEQWSLMKQADEDATLTQLCGALVMASTGKSRAEEAIYAYQTLSEQYGPSHMLLNCMAVAHMVVGDFTQAQGKLEEALEMSNGAAVGSEGATTLINLIAVYQNLGNSAKVDETVILLKKQHASHPYVQSLATVEAAFQRVSAQYS